jgi:hypothetical protein
VHHSRSYFQSLTYTVRAFNIFQMYYYLQAVLFLKQFLNLGNTNYHFKWVKVPGTALYWKACSVFKFDISILTSVPIFILQFAVNIRLPDNLTNEQIQETLDMIIDELDLRKCLDASKLLKIHGIHVFRTLDTDNLSHRITDFIRL